MPSGNETAPPAVILLSGLPASGKTTFAAALVHALDCDHLESDAVRRAIFPAPAYSFAESRVVFAEMERRVARSLAAGQTVVVDATNLAGAHRGRFAAVALRCGVRMVTVRLTVPAAVARDRLGGPRDGFSQADVAVYESMLGTVERPSGAVVTVDGRFPFDAALRLVAGLVEESP